MSDADIQKAVSDAAMFEEEDKKKKEKIETKNEVDSLTFQLQNTLKQLDEKITNEKKDEIDSIINEIKTITSKEDISDDELETLKQKEEKILSLFQELSSTIYSQNNINNTSNTTQTSKQYKESNDDIIDGDYREI